MMVPSINFWKTSVELLPFGYFPLLSMEYWNMEIPIPVVTKDDLRGITCFQSDVLIAWENEALLSVKKTNPGEFEIVYPSQTILEHFK